MKQEFQTLLKVVTVLIVANMVTLSANAAIYKWVDENGQTVYSETPPPRGTQASRLKKQAAPSTDPQKAMEELRTRAEEFSKRRDEKVQGKEDVAKKDDQAKAQQERCKQLKTNLEALSSGQRIRETKPDGESAYLDDTQKQARLKSTQESISKECK